MQPVFIEFASVFHFGASTRRYILRGKLENANDEDELNKDLLPQEHELEVTCALLPYRTVILKA